MPGPSASVPPDATVDELRRSALDLAREAEVARARLANLIDHAPAFVCTLRGPEHVFEMANPLYMRLIGVERSFLGRPVAEAIPEVVEQGFIGILDRVYQTGVPFLGNETPLQLARVDGQGLETVFLNFVYQPARDAHGVIGGIDVFGFEVTEQVLARQRVESLAAAVSNERYKLEVVVASSPAAVAIWSGENLVFEMVNAGYQALFPDRQLVGRPLFAAIPEAEQGFAEILSAVYRTGVPFIGREVELKMAFREGQDVEARYFDVIYVRMDNSDGSPSGLYNSAVDVSDRVRARLQLERQEAELRERAERTATLLDTMSDAFLALDAGWRITNLNRTFERLAQVRREDVVGKVFWDVFPTARADDSVPGSNYRRCMRDRVPVEFVSHYRALDLWTDTRAAPTSDGGIAAFLRDVTEAQRADDAIRRQAAFERQLIGIVSHDLRTPLNVVAVAATLLRRQDDLSAAAAKHVLRIQNAGERATRMIRDLLDFTQARLGGGIRVERRAMDLHAVTRAVLDEIEATHPDRTLRLDTDGDGQGAWDEDRLGQVVQNLVTNALKHGDETGAVEVVTRGEEATVTLSVHNRGVPIEADRIPTLFEPFERGAPSGDMATRSVGLGLYIVEQVVVAHGGTVAVRSTADEGTTFVVTLPRVATGST